MIALAVDPLLHARSWPVAVRTLLPQLLDTTTTGAAGIAFGAAVAEPAALVQPFTVCVTLYKPAAGLVNDGTVCPLLHCNEPVAFVEMKELPQLSETLTTGVAGMALTVKLVDADAPQLLVKVMVAVPAALPVTFPFWSTDATAGFDELHVPPVATDGVDNMDPAPAHTVRIPEIGATVVGVTVTVKSPEVSLPLGSAAVT